MRQAKGLSRDYLHATRATVEVLDKETLEKEANGSQGLATDGRPVAGRPPRLETGRNAPGPGPSGGHSSSNATALTLKGGGGGRGGVEGRACFCTLGLWRPIAGPRAH